MVEILIRPDGPQSWLRCDDCGAQNSHRSFVVAPADADEIRRHLRACGMEMGWGFCPTIEDGWAFIIDLCPRCCERLRRVL